MGDRTDLLRTSRQRYRAFIRDYKARRLDETADAPKTVGDPSPKPKVRAGRRAYVRAYLRWLRPHRRSLTTVLLLALVVAGMEMVDPLFMRFIVDRVLLNTELDTAARLAHLHLAGGLFLAAVVLTKLTGVVKDYRQKLLNTRVMLSLRRALYDRLLHLPLPRLWDMKTGGILSRL